MTSHHEVDLVIPVWNCEAWIDGCLQAVVRQTRPPRRVIVVDDASDDRSREKLERWRSRIVLLENPRQLGFASSVNLGIDAGDAPLVALLNADTVADPDWLNRLASALETSSPEVGSAASCMVQLADRARIDSAGDSFSRYGSACKRGRDQPVEGWSSDRPPLSACGGAALYRRRALEEIGGFDTGYGSYLEDVDLGLRLRLAGYDCIYVPTARVAHAGGGSGLPRGHYVRLLTANRAATALKNLPATVLARRALTLTFGQLYFLIAYRAPVQSFLGYSDLLLRLPTILRQRRQIQRRRRLTPRECDRLLTDELGEPPLRELALRRLSRRRRSAA